MIISGVAIEEQRYHYTTFKAAGVATASEHFRHYQRAYRRHGQYLIFLDGEAI